ncbi:MAG: metallophosphoesterase [Anaerolineales bacterium]|nr:metallophosphoesterase [Anaerolineales bacterium]
MSDDHKRDIDQYKRDLKDHPYHVPGSFSPRLVIFLIFILICTSQIGCKILGAVTTPVTDTPQIPTQILQPTSFVENVPISTITLAQNPPLLPSETPTISPTPAPDYFANQYPLSDNHYIIPLTVRHITIDRAIFFFELSQPAEGRLVYRSIEADHPIQGEIAISADESRHMLTVENLLPGIEYQALVLLGTDFIDFQRPAFNGTDWGAVNFRTVSGETPIKVGVLGDASFGDEATQTLIAFMASQDLDFVLHTGDVVYETDNTDLVYSYSLKYFEPFSPLLHQLPVYTVMGNHDYDRAVEWQGNPFYDYAFPAFSDPDFTYPGSRRGNQYYALAYQDVQFLMLDSQVLFGEAGRAEQETWMKERLSDARYRITIPVFHVAPFSSSAVHPDDSLPVRYAWLPIFEASNVPVAFSGHFHHYERLMANGITYIVTGGGSSTLYAQGSPLAESQIYVRRTHFVRMEIYKDRIELQAIAKEGDIIDQATILLQ